MLSQTEARDLVERCMRVLYYRDARSYNRVRRGVNNGGEGDLIGRFSILANAKGFCALKAIPLLCLFSYLGKTLLDL